MCTLICTITIRTCTCDTCMYSADMYSLDMYNHDTCACTMGARLFRHVTYMYVSGKMTSNWGEGLLVFSECSEMHTFD